MTTTPNDLVDPEFLASTSPELRLTAAIETIRKAHLADDQDLELQALAFLRAHAAKGEYEACLKISTLYENDDSGMPKDPQEAMLWSRSIFDKQIAKALQLCARELTDREALRRHPHSTFALIAETATRSQPNASYLAAIMLTKGVGISQNVDGGLRFLIQAAEANQLDAQYELARFYGVRFKYSRKDIQKSLFWYHCAIQNGDTRAVIDLAYTEMTDWFKIFAKGLRNETITYFVNDNTRLRGASKQGKLHDPNDAEVKLATMPDLVTQQGKRHDAEVELTTMMDMITLDDDPNNLRIKMPCGHAIGPESLTAYCRSILEAGGFKFICPHIGDLPSDRCNAEWEYHDVCKLGQLSKDDREMFETMINNNYMSLVKGMQKCPKCQSYCDRSDKNTHVVVCSICTNQSGAVFAFCWKCLCQASATYKCTNPDCRGNDPKLAILRTARSAQSTPSLRAAPARTAVSLSNTSPPVSTLSAGALRTSVSYASRLANPPANGNAEARTQSAMSRRCRRRSRRWRDRASCVSSGVIRSDDEKRISVRCYNVRKKEHQEGTVLEKIKIKRNLRLIQGTKGFTNS
ncbi:LOW QUALITY PROTEIN: hypothetical protein BC936DRAFT_145248 [Jimgerdemannia flammicorona]|uniref:RING-type domain-containing protein n=1 Tax=Jimgerdemannia flammicorona TaxID=994334 RepID=A0A433DAG7_9FUNG|nr:LOW QUALITY PROTEIN: hypothetical protein BC936DRAFT_145248 [Jimgerdemannia flammicorona]